MIDLDSCEKEQPEPQINIEKYDYEPFAKTETKTRISYLRNIQDHRFERIFNG